MKNIFNHKTHLTTKVSVLTLLLLLSIALPLLVIPASAVATITLTPTSGPNGTSVSVSGGGFGANEVASQLTITVNGLSTKVASNSLATNSTGGFTGSSSFVIGGAGSLNLVPGTYSIQISDATTAPPAVSFTITAPTVTLAPATGPAGTSVLVSANGFATASNQITSATFAGTNIYVIGKFTGFTGSVTNSTNGFNGVVTNKTATSGDPLTLGVGSQVTLTSTTTTFSATITPSAAWTGNGSLTGTLSTPILTGNTTTVTGSFSGTVLFADIGTLNVEVVTVTITVPSYAVTGTLSALSSNTISRGSYTGTVSLPGITTGSAFTLTDNYGNIATTTFALNAPTVTLSPVSGPVGTLVTATVTGFGPGASVASVKIGNSAPLTSLSSLVPTPPMVTEQGTSAFMFTVAASPSPNFAAGSQAITVTDSLANAATATFTITPTVTMTLGVGAVNSGVAFAPTGTANVVSFLSAAGFKPSTVLTITSSPGVPAGWTTFTAGGYPTVTTDANGQVAIPIVSGTGTAPASGIYSVTVSDGTNTVTVLLTITSSGSFFVISPSSGAQGTTVTLTGFLATPASTTAINFDGVAIAGATQCAANTWPAVPSTLGSFTVPTSGSGAHTITATGITGSATFTNTGAPAISVVSPTSAAVGTTVTIVGSGFAKAGVSLAAFSIDSVTVPVATVTFNSGAMIATFVVPAFLPTTHIISVTDSAFNTATASLITTVSSISVSPTSSVIAGAKPITISITGSGFPMAQGLTVRLDSTTLTVVQTGLTTTNTNGGIIIYTTNITAGFLTVAGPHTITVSAGTASATATFTVNPIITLSTALNTNLVTAVRTPATVPISGAGFAANAALTVSLNGTTTTWFNTGSSLNTTSITTDASGNIPAAAAVIITQTTPGSIPITVTDSLGNTASATLTLLGTPSISLAATQGIAGVGTVGITGSGFTPGSRVALVQIFQGTTLVSAAAQTASPITITGTGTITVNFGTSVESFTVPNAAAGAYTVNLTLSSPTESAIATFTILGQPVVTTSVTSAIVGTNVTLSVVGLTNVATATLGGTLANLLVTPGTTFGSQTPLTTGANAYNLTTWFIVPSIQSGTYTMLLSDTGGIRSVTTTFTVLSAMKLSPTTGILKGSNITISGTGFATAGTAFNVTVNGALIALAAGTTGSGGTVATSFAVPLTASATANNTVVVTDTAGNTATASFMLTAPTIALTPTTGSVGSTVQILGNGFTPSSPIIVEVGASIVNTAPANLMSNTGGSFIAYVTIPAGLSGNQTITAIDSSNNVGTAIFAVITGGATGFTVDQAALSSTAQTLNSAGSPATSFARGSTVKLSFVLDSTSGSGNVVWRVTLQQGTAVYNIATTTASISTTPSTLTFTQLIPTTVSPGTWTASIQIFAPDGVTPLGVATLTFNVT